MRLRTCARLAAMAGVLLLVANVRGGSLLLELGDRFAAQHLAPEVARPVHLVVAALLFVAGLGGLAVVAGGVAYAQRTVRAGSLLIGLGAGMGLLGLAMLVVASLLAGQPAMFLAWLLGPAGAGVALSIAARRGAREHVR